MPRFWPALEVPAHEDSINDLVAYGALYGEARLASMNQPESDWIEWGGGECPVPEGTPVMIRMRNGREYGPLPADASKPFWRNDSCLVDIIAYRIVK